MAKKKTKEEIQLHSQNALKTLESLLNSYIESEDYSIVSKADKLSYWLEAYSRLLKNETTFIPSKLKRYKRGEILKIDLGYNVGSEEGGLHYCIVLDKNNSIHNPVITVVPLTSVKPTTNLEKLRPGSIYLGNSLYITMFTKLSSLEKVFTQESKKIINHCDALEEVIQKALLENSEDNPSEEALKFIFEELAKIKEEAADTNAKKAFIEKVLAEISKMKQGSIALISQITTVSKLRIYDPKTSRDVLSGIRLSNENLDAIDEEIKKLYLK